MNTLNDNINHIESILAYCKGASFALKTLLIIKTNQFPPVYFSEISLFNIRI